MNTCPYCQSKERQVKAGKNSSGSQRIKCQQCQRKYTPDPNEIGYPADLRLQAVKMDVDGMNYRRIGRHLGVDHKRVMDWVDAHVAQLPAAPQPDDVIVRSWMSYSPFSNTKKQSLCDDCGGLQVQLHTGLGGGSGAKRRNPAKDGRSCTAGSLLLQ